LKRIPVQKYAKLVLVSGKASQPVSAFINRTLGPHLHIAFIFILVFDRALGNGTQNKQQELST